LVHIPDIVLTAAHCDAVTSDAVYVGSYRNTGNGEARGEKRMITNRERHPNYVDSTVDYDYMVMKLDSPVSITPVELNANGDVPINSQPLTVIGYGKLSDGIFGGTPSKLQEVDVNYIPPDECNAAYNGEINGNTMFCAGVGGGKDSCQGRCTTPLLGMFLPFLTDESITGDSGGPIFIENPSTSTFTQIGIVSWGYGCADPVSKYSI